MLSTESPLIEQLVNEPMSRDLRTLLQTVLLDLLRAKFGEVPVNVIAKVRAIRDVERSRQLLTQAGAWTDLDAFRTQLPS